MTTGELVTLHAELTGEPVRKRHRTYPLRNTARRLQANAEGGLSARARVRATQVERAMEM